MFVRTRILFGLVGLLLWQPVAFGQARLVQDAVKSRQVTGKVPTGRLGKPREAEEKVEDQQIARKQMSRRERQVIRKRAEVARQKAKKKRVVAVID